MLYKKEKIGDYNKQTVDSFSILVSKGLREQLVEYTFTELVNVALNELTREDIFKNVKRIKKSVYDKIEPRIRKRNLEYKRYIKKYISHIVNFLTKIKVLNETNQKINVTEVAREIYEENFISLAHWEVIALKTIRFLRVNFNFNIRSKFYDSLPNSSRMSLKQFKTLYDLINNRTIIYLDTDYNTEILIHYDGKCQGKNGSCCFNIDYRFLPALSYDHLLKLYKSIVTREGYEYTMPSRLLKLALNNAIKKMQTQIGGLGLVCLNCHSYKHHKRYYFHPIFTFLKQLVLEDISKNPKIIINTAKELAIKYFNQNKDKFKLSKKNPRSNIISNIKSSILGYVKKNMLYNIFLVKITFVLFVEKLI